MTDIPDTALDNPNALAVARALAGRYPNQYQKPKGSSGSIIEAVVFDAFSHLHSHFITSPFMGMMPAFLMSNSSSLLPIGVKDHSLLMPGTEVMAWAPDDKDWAVILGTRGSVVTSRNIAQPYSIVPASRVGLFDDEVHKFVPFGSSEPKGAFNASAGRPVDALPGEWGMSTELSCHQEGSGGSPEGA